MATMVFKDRRKGAAEDSLFNIPGNGDKPIIPLLNGWELLSLYSFSQLYNKEQNLHKGNTFDDILRDICEKNGGKFLNQFRRFHFCVIRLVENTSSKKGRKNDISLIPFGSSCVLHFNGTDSPRKQAWLNIINPNNGYTLRDSDIDSGSNDSDTHDILIDSFITGETRTWSLAEAKGKSNTNLKFSNEYKTLDIYSQVIVPLKYENKIFGTFSCMKLEKNRAIAEKRVGGDPNISPNDQKLVEEYVTILSAYLVRQIANIRRKESGNIFKYLEESTKDVISGKISKEGFCGIIKEEVENFLACDCSIYEKVSYSVDERAVLAAKGWGNLSLKEFYKTVMGKNRIPCDNLSCTVDLKKEQKEIYHAFIASMRNNEVSYVLSEKLFRIFEIYFRVNHLEKMIRNDEKDDEIQDEYLAYWKININKANTIMTNTRLDDLSFLMPFPSESYESSLYVLLDSGMEHIPFEGITGYAGRKVAVSYIDGRENISNHPSNTLLNGEKGSLHSQYSIAAKYGDHGDDVIVLKIQNSREDDYNDDNRDFIDLLAAKLHTLFSVISTIKKSGEK